MILRVQTLVTLEPPDAGELLTLRRAAYVTEARAHHDLDLPPLRESLDDLLRELADPELRGLGWRASGGAHPGRLLGAVRVRLPASEPGVAEIGRLAVAPDQQRQGLGSALLAEAEGRLPASVRQVRLFTGEHSLGNLRLYARMGYAETHRTTAPAGYLLIHLAKSLRHQPSP